MFEELNSRFLPRHSWKFRESKRGRLVNKNKIQRVFGNKCRWKRCFVILIKDVQRVITHVYSFNIEIFDSVNPSQSSMERYSIMDNKVVTKIVWIGNPQWSNGQRLRLEIRRSKVQILPPPLLFCRMEKEKDDSGRLQKWNEGEATGTKIGTRTRSPGRRRNNNDEYLIKH